MIGQTVSHYKILEKVGEGGMGAVYKAEDTKLKRTVALKFLPPELTRNTKAKTRFIHEAQAASALQHNNICAIHEIDETRDGRIFICMDCYEGGSLKETIAGGPQSLPDALDIVIQVADGLAEAHSRGIVHRDIKPANIVMTESGVAKIVDFGLAKLAGQTRVTRTGTTVGTVSYMSPEQATGREVDHRSDIWALGVVLYELLAGRPPFEGEHEAALLYQIVHEEPKPIASICPETPAAVARILDRALAKDADARYASAAEFMADLQVVRRREQAAEAGAHVHRSLLQTVARPRYSVPGVVLLLALGTLLWWWQDRQAKVRWARSVALPEIEQLAEDVPWTGEGPETWRAFELATEASQYIPDDPLLTRLWSLFSRYTKIDSDPTGAEVYAKPYADVESDWRYVGRTPIDGIRFPEGYSRVRLEREGFRTTYDLVSNVAWPSDSVTLKLHYRLPETGSIPDDMEFVPGDSMRLHLPGLDRYEPKRVGDFLMDRYEVTNEAFKRFVDNGGYRDPKYWRHPFVRDGRRLTWNEAMTFFTDRTGRPGPATWEVGDYPAGEKDHPVAGVSWYEAAAYAEFVGKSLPTIYHWDRAARVGTIPEVVLLCNMGGDGTVPVGSSRSMNRFGVYDMAGNAREWCFNRSSRGEQDAGHFILGGGWNDPAYAFTSAFAQLPFDRSETNGFRCIRYLGHEEGREELEEAIELPFRDFLNEPKISDETFATFLKQYDYDKTDLNAVVEWTREEEGWIREKITFDAAYGNERVVAYLFLPKHGAPPFQTVVYFPGITATYLSKSDDFGVPFAVTLAPGSRSFLQKSGRAVLYPVYKGTYERADGFKWNTPMDSHFYKEHLIMWAKDLSRSIDYLETRDDIDADKIAYFGYSWGSTLGAIMAVVEPRIKASVLLVAGLDFPRCLPEADPIHYLPRLTTPVLLLNGKYDFFFPYETAQLPFFELIGTPEPDKKLFLAESSHIVPRTDLIGETLDWLDRYLGPVE